MTSCTNCRAPLSPGVTFCAQCGLSQNSRLCPNGHIMDASWTQCRYCQSVGALGTKGRTVVEGGSSDLGTKGRTLAEGGSPSGGFVGGATLLGDTAGPGEKRRTVVEAGSQKGQTQFEGPAGGRSKARTVFDSGSAEASTGASATTSRLVGWLVTFSLASSGQDYRLREGRNIIGSEASECDIAIANEASISGKHAVIVCRDNQLLLRDNDSTNGTFVNGGDIFGRGAVPIKNLDRVRLGRVEFILYTLEQ